MAHIRRRAFTKPVPAGAAILEKDGAPAFAEWLDAGGKRRRAPVVRTQRGLRLRCQTKRYYVEWTDASGRRRCTKGYTDRKATEQLAAELERKAARGAAGLLDPFEGHGARPLAEHLADYRRELESRDNAPRYVELALSRLAELCGGCGFLSTRDLDAGGAGDWLASRRRDPSRPALPAGKEWFTLKEGAAAVGVKPASFGTAVARARLAAEGNGKARRFPRATVEALLDARGRGMSAETANQYLRQLKSFASWLVRSGRLAANPFLNLEAGNAALDRRHDRRELAEGELRRLLAAARSSGRPFRGLSGEERFHLYLVAITTGFRAGGLASLTPESFDLDGEVPTVTLGARDDKSRRGKVQPLPADVADLLRPYLAGKPAGEPIWPGSWARLRVAAHMLRLDLAEANIPYAIDGPDGKLFADFHALRHSYLTLLGRSGVDLRTAQELAGHSSPELTARYTHRRLHDLAGAVGKLPSLLPGLAEADTSANAPTPAAEFATELALGPDTASRQDALPCAKEQADHLVSPSSQPSASSPVSSVSQSDAPPGTERVTGFEPVTSSLGSWHSTTELHPHRIVC